MCSLNFNLVIGEFGVFDILLDILKAQSQIQFEDEDDEQMKSSVG